MFRIRALKNILYIHDNQQKHIYKRVQSNIIILHQHDPADGHRIDQNMSVSNNNNNNLFNLFIKAHFLVITKV